MIGSFGGSLHVSVVCTHWIYFEIISKLYYMSRIFWFVYSYQDLCWSNALIACAPTSSELFALCGLPLPLFFLLQKTNRNGFHCAPTAGTTYSICQSFQYSRHLCISFYFFCVTHSRCLFAMYLTDAPSIAHLHWAHIFLGRCFHFGQRGRNEAIGNSKIRSLMSIIWYISRPAGFLSCGYAHMTEIGNRTYSIRLASAWHFVLIPKLTSCL